ncbi:36462_t:CDS:1, partial [Racocetra persica]
LSQINIDENNEIEESLGEFFSQQISVASITCDRISKKGSRTLSIPNTAFEQISNLCIGIQFEY